MQEIDISLSTGSQSMDIGLSQTSQSVGLDINSGGLAYVHHDETLIGDGTNLQPLGVDIKKVMATYVYEQGISSSVWEIEHNLDRYPTVTVVDSANTRIELFDVQYIDKNNLIIRFNAGFNGKAYLN